MSKPADPQPESPTPPQHPTLAEAVRIFDAGDHRRARQLLADVPTDLTGEDARWRARLGRAVTLDPALLAAMVIMAVIWTSVFFKTV